MKRALKTCKWIVFISVLGMLSHTHGQTRESGLDVQWSSYGFARYSHTSFRSSLFNPRGFTVKKLALQPNDASWAQTISLDAAFGRWSLRTAWRAELQRDTEWNFSGQFMQLSGEVEFDNFVLLAGRSILRWGTGYAFNPTDFVAPDKSISDPENRDGKISGQDLIKAEYFTELISIAGCFMFPKTVHSLQDLQQTVAAFRLYLNAGSTDLSLLASFSDGNRPLWGVNSSIVLGDRIEIHGELSFSRAKVPNLLPFLHASPGQSDDSPLSFEGRQTFTSLLGFQITLPPDILLITEYFHTTHGLGQNDWNRFVDHMSLLRDQMTPDPTPQTEGAFFTGLSTIHSGRAGRGYLFIHIQSPLLNRFSIRSTLFVNLLDSSRILMPELTARLKNDFTLFFRGLIFQGNSESEYGALFQSHQLEGGIRFLI